MHLFALITLVVISVPASAADNIVVETELEVQADLFEGYEHRFEVENATSFIEKRDIASAWEALGAALVYCDTKLTNDDFKYVSVCSKEESSLFIRSHSDRSSVVFIDIACPLAYKTAAFLAVGAGDTSKAFKFLDKAQHLAPYWAEPYAERASLLNHLGDNANALIAYRHALNLATEYKSSGYVRAVALRGIGFTLTELGDFAGAMKAYKESLAIDPSNQLAKDELVYIERLQQNKK